MSGLLCSTHAEQNRRRVGVALSKWKEEPPLIKFTKNNSEIIKKDHRPRQSEKKRNGKDFVFSSVERLARPGGWYHLVVTLVS